MAVYFAKLSSSGVGAWASTTSYPTNISGQSCVTYGGYIYCVSGIDGARGPRPTGAVYFAPTSMTGGLGAWTKSTDYPSPSIALSCAAFEGYVYCVGGDQTVGTLESDLVYFAPITSSGVGTWTATTKYPITVNSAGCAASAGFIYCVAGYTAAGPRPVNVTYYASISSSGAGTWTASTAYPIADPGPSCVMIGGYIYCVGGSTNDVYYASVSSTGIGTWTSGARYPIATSVSCVALESTIACVGGSASDGTTKVYYLNIAK
jgi:hypothetical protein